jgi:Tol biopolymer transport system component
MSLNAGAKLGPYEIGGSIGAGGMGEVYRARDTRLGRDIALKILPASFARDEDRLRRFQQETQAVAALNHPNILAIYDVGQHDGVPFLISELLQGEPLRGVLEHGALPPRRATDYGTQIAQGLAAAHQKGVVHRDLKPDNLFVTAENQIKILDFGLAKLATQGSGSSSDGLTLTGSHTVAGAVMGTAGYMSPEQVRGEAVDARADIFAFGAVLFEMLSGQQAFRRDTAAETMTAVLKEEPPDLAVAQLPISPAMDRIVRRCLEKNPEQRFQSAKDLSFALSSLSGIDSGGVRALPRERHALPWLWIAAVLALIVAAFIGGRLASRVPPTARMQFAIPVSGEVNHMALSPDGAMLAFVSPDDKSGVPMLFVQRIGSAGATELSATEGASFPFWSPDDAFIAFFAGGKLYKISASGENRQALATAAIPRGGSWGRKNVIVFAPGPGGAIWRVNSDGSNAAPLTQKFFEKIENSHRWPVFLPDGDHFVFWAGNFSNFVDDRNSGIYMSSLDASYKKLIVLARSAPAFGAGRLFYADDKRALVAAPLDISAARLTGEPRMITDQVGYQPSTYMGAFTVAGDGTVVYSAVAGASLSALTWHDRNGKDLGRVGESGVIANPMLSPDESRVTVDITDVKANNVDVWIYDLRRGTTSRFTFDPSEETAGIWSRDSRRIAFRGAVNGITLFSKAAEGLEPEIKMAEMPGSDDLIPNSWSADDTQVLCTAQPPDGTSNLALVPASGGTAKPFLSNKASQTNGQISPDGKWVAYSSNESGDWEIYVTNFPGASGKWQISRGGGSEPRWRGDGKEIFYIAPSGMLMSVSVDTAGLFATGTPAPLFQIHGRPPISSTDLFTYDVSKDGKRFLVDGYVKPDHIDPLIIVQHALSESGK